MMQPDKKKKMSFTGLLYYRILPIVLAIGLLCAGTYMLYTKAQFLDSQDADRFLRQSTPPTLCKDATPGSEQPSCFGPALDLNLPPHSSHTAIPTISSASNVTFSPLSLSSSGPELANPLRGAQYYGGEDGPEDWPYADRYERICWSMIEPQEGQYNFAWLDQHLAAAKEAGYTFGFRIMPINPSEGGSCLPSYLMGMTGGNGGFPNFNSPAYLDRARALFTALGARYNNDPRLGWLDMSLYGCWGEWNLSCGSNITPMSLDNQRALINMQIQSLSNKGFLMLTDSQSALNYALSIQRSKPIGVRIDCLGRDGLGGAKDELDNNATERDRWRVAPLYFEYCSDPDLAEGLVDVKTYHASLIGDGDGNLNDFSSYSSSDQNLLRQTFKISGYRYVLNSITLPSKLIAGQTFTLLSRWSNTNIAPTYDPWNVMFQLRDASGKVAWQKASQLHLQTLLPTSDGSGNTPVSTKDQFTLSNSLPTGTYTLSVQVVDPTGYYSPLQLAIQGAQSDGSYNLGLIQIKAA